MITKEFIREWEPKYDESESDESEYQRLVDAVEAEAERDQVLTHETFIDILDWKAARVKGKIDKQHPERYRDAFRRVLTVEMSADEKMEMLWSLPGIGAPVASTILHFMFPDDMPIYDRRTVEALNRFSCIEQSKTSESGYSEFRSALLQIRDDLGEFTLRQIDRALFAYHKVEMEKKGQARNNLRHRNRKSDVSFPARSGDTADVDRTIEAKITNIATHADRKRSGPRLELCFSWEYEDLFPDHKESFTMLVGGTNYRMTIGKPARSPHMYVHTWCHDTGENAKKITELLQSVGLGEGDRPRIRVLGRYQFELIQ